MQTFLNHLNVHNYLIKTQNTERCLGAPCENTVISTLIDYDLEYSCFILNLNSKTSRVLIMGWERSCCDPVTTDQGSNKTKQHWLPLTDKVQTLYVQFGSEASDWIEFFVRAKNRSVTSCIFTKQKIKGNNSLCLGNIDR